MKIIESAFRISIVTFVALVWLAMALLPLAAHAWDDDDKPKPAPPAKVWPAPASEDHHREAFWAGAAAGGLGIAALQKTEHPWLYTVAAGVALSALAGATDSVSNREARYAALGVMTGATGIGLVYGRNFWGWQTAIRW